MHRLLVAKLFENLLSSISECISSGKYIRRYYSSRPICQHCSTTLVFKFRQAPGTKCKYTFSGSLEKRSLSVINNVYRKLSANCFVRSFTFGSPESSCKNALCNFFIVKWLISFFEYNPYGIQHDAHWILLIYICTCTC